MGDHRLPKRVISGELENAGKRGPGGKEKEWTDCVADDLRLFGVTGDWRTAALDPGAWYNIVHEGGCRFMAAWVREEENACNQRQKKREAEEAEKVEVAPGVTVASLRRFRTALIGPPQGYRMARGWHYAKLSLSNARRLSFSGMCILLFLFLSLCRFYLFVFFLLLSLELGRCSSDLFLSSRPRTALATTYSTGCG